MPPIMSVRKFFPVLVPVVFALGVIGLVLMSGGRDEEDIERAALVHVRKELAGTIIARESPRTSGHAGRVPSSLNHVFSRHPSPPALPQQKKIHPRPLFN